MRDRAKNLIDSWLEVQSQLLVGSLRAIVLVGNPSAGPVMPAAVWPDTGASTPGLSNAAAAALQQRRIVVRAKDSAPAATRQRGDIVAAPILRDKDVIGVVAVEITARPQAEQRRAAKILALNTVWLELLMREGPARNDSHTLAVVDLVAASVEHAPFEAAANSTATRFATRLGCERVSLGFLRRDHIEVRTMSGTATLNPKMRLTRAIGAAMDEAIAQDATIVFPNTDKKNFFATRCHEELAGLNGGGGICTIPISQDGELVGAATLEHEDEKAFNENTLALCETVISLTGPILYEKYRQDRWFGAKLSESVSNQLGKFVTPGHLLLKASAAALLCVVAFLSTANGEYRVTAEAILEGTVQRVIVAPVDGYIKEAAARAGDVVEKGQVLARLDDKDLELELREWSSEKAKLQREYRQAMAELDSTRVSILRAQIDQATARLALTAENLARTHITSPMHGIIISGDLSQSLGTPVERGDPLFKVAPLDSYRVMLEVDERDIRNLSPGQAGRLALVGFPNEYLPFSIERITPIATAADGRNYFAVEAQLEHHPQQLRPGMKGIGKIDIGERRLMWIWSHKLIDWFRLWTWTWSP